MRLIAVRLYMKDQTKKWLEPVGCAPHTVSYILCWSIYARGTYSGSSLRCAMHTLFMKGCLPSSNMFGLFSSFVFSNNLWPCNELSMLAVP